ncbi:ABC transporter ATP-binding protein [Deinococcus aquiradiocola]|uniref:Bacitracin ABC transporter ATP-binding protein n=1 Tax=Deinococcus aquiradiocola TaxID=393059 RepID=A0A917PH95_9DEIO|nr:ABC transporter ATP-binding protein [Deinococcus aquiradiocola]GGJ77324.1 bacitracin ABC transporter ATP-binding protein [Deinococcus aquiradiocola]
MLETQTVTPAPTLTPALSVSGVHKNFGAFVALEGVDLDIWPGEFISIIGHSGCGKSTLLNLVAGLDLPSTGRVSLFGRPIEGPGPERAMVFQNYSLLPWLSVRQNVLDAVRASVPQMPRGQREAVSEQVLKMVGLWTHRDKKPGHLSGGQRQRVAIARAFAVQPRVLLLDEPFGALDAITKSNLQDELLQMWSGPESGISNVLMVTHDIDEAIYLSDRIVVMSNGPRAHIHEVLKVDLPRPRERAQLVTDPTYLALKAHMLDLLGRVLAH